VAQFCILKIAYLMPICIIFSSDQDKDFNKSLFILTKKHKPYRWTSFTNYDFV